jgi:hypothetical protein
VPITFAYAIDTCWSVTGDWHGGDVVPTFAAGIAVVPGAAGGKLVEREALQAASSSTPIAESRAMPRIRMGDSASSRTSETPVQIAPSEASTQGTTPVRLIFHQGRSAACPCSVPP